jgi:predicted DNA-binding transcriptional regulator YafY
VTAYGNYNQITTYCYELQTNSQLLMTEHRKISRVLQLIARLRHPIGHRKTDLARRFGVNVRTIERYIILLKELGFNVLQDGNRFRIAFIDNKGFKQEEHIVFTLEEAMVIKEALLNSNAIGPLRNILLDKLYSLTDIDDLATTMSKLNHSNNITVINKAIKNKVQVVLKEYNSARSAACDRLVEPIRFYAYFQYLKAYELKAKRVKIFKTERIGGAELTLAPWVFEERHEELNMDPFGISGTEAVKVHIRMGKRAWQLLCEEHPDAVPAIVPHNSKWDYTGDVYGFEGVGRFVMGLIDQVEVIAPAALKEYVRESIVRSLESGVSSSVSDSVSVIL